jgi:hypothetical protein
MLETVGFVHLRSLQRANKSATRELSTVDQGQKRRVDSVQLAFLDVT